MMRRSFALSSAVLLAAAGSAFAQDASSLDSGRAMLRPSTTKQAEIGVGIGVGPSYLGSGKRSWAAGPYAEATFGNGVFLSTVDGIGYRFLEDPSGFSMAASIGPSMMRREKDGEDGNTNRLKGMGDVNVRPQANLFLNYDKNAFHSTVALHQTLGSRHGTELEVEGSYDLLADRENLVRATAGFAYANRDLMQTFFGVTSAQSASSGNPVYTPGAGIAGSGASISWRHAFSKEWVGSVGAGVIDLRGSAGDSPLVTRFGSRTQLSESVAFIYHL